MCSLLISGLVSIIPILTWPDLLQHVPLLVQMGAVRGIYSLVALGPGSVQQLADRTANSLADELMDDFIQAQNDVIITSVRKVSELSTEFLASGVGMAIECRDKITAKLSKGGLSAADVAVVSAQRDAIEVLLAQDVLELVAEACSLLTAKLEAGEGGVHAPPTHYAGRAERREQTLAVRQQVQEEVQELAVAVETAQTALEARRQQLAGLEAQLAGMRV